MAKEILEKIEIEGEYKLLITWKAYELHPLGLEADLAFLPINANDYIRDIWKRIENVARENDVPIEFPAALSKSRLALEASEFARIQPEKYDTFHDLMFKAYFLEKKDIEKMKVVLEIGEKAWLDPQELKAELDSGIYTSIIERSKQEAMSLGMNGVPAFIVGTEKKMLFTGCQPLDTFKKIFEDSFRKNQPS